MPAHNLTRATVAVVGLLAVFAVAGTSLQPDSLPTPSSPSPSTPSPTPPPGGDQPYRAFEADSWWNTPLPTNAPQNPAAAEILNYLRTGDESGGGCLTLAGAGDSPWGQPIYWASPRDDEVDVTGVAQALPPELDELRMPANAEPAANNDSTMSIFDLEKGYVVALTDAEYDADDDQWSATGATVTYLNSNGLHVSTGRSDDRRNIGSHRGNNGATMAVRWDMVRAGVIPHVLKIAAGPEVSDRFVFPMVGSDGDYFGFDPEVPPEGIRLRIKPSVDLEALSLHPQALVIARALQDYGAYIGDSGGVTALKLENTMAEGLGQLWGVTATDLCGLPFDPEYWDVVAEGFDPTEDS